MLAPLFQRKVSFFTSSQASASLQEWRNLEITIRCQSRVSFFLTTVLGRGWWEWRVGDLKITGGFVFYNVSLFLFPSECTPLEASQQGGTSFSRLNALAPVNILSAASPWDEQIDTNHCVDAGKGRGRGWRTCSFFLLQSTIIRGIRSKLRKMWIPLFQVQGDPFRYYIQGLTFSVPFQHKDIALTDVSRHINWPRVHTWHEWASVCFSYIWCCVQNEYHEIKRSQCHHVHSAKTANS